MDFPIQTGLETKQQRKSTSGYIFKMLYGEQISRKCKKQSTVALSSSKAENVALTLSCPETIFWYNFQNTIDSQIRIKIFVDNQSAIALSHILKCLLFFKLQIFNTMT